MIISLVFTPGKSRKVPLLQHHMGPCFEALAIISPPYSFLPLLPPVFLSNFIYEVSAQSPLSFSLTSLSLLLLCFLSHLSLCHHVFHFLFSSHSWRKFLFSKLLTRDQLFFCCLQNCFYISSLPMQYTVFFTRITSILPPAFLTFCFEIVQTSHPYIRMDSTKHAWTLFPRLIEKSAGVLMTILTWQSSVWLFWWKGNYMNLKFFYQSYKEKGITAVSVINLKPGLLILKLLC